MCYFVKKITHFYKKGRFLTKIFQVYEGKIAVFAISDEQIHAHAQFIKPIDVEFFAITREIRDHQELATARAIANGLHVRKRAKEMLAVFFAQIFRFRTHATENFNTRDHVVAIEPVIEGVFAATQQNGAVALFRKDAVEIVYPERNTAPSKERKRDKEARANSKCNPMGVVWQIRFCIIKNRRLRPVAERRIPANSKQIQRNQVTQELFALETRNRVFTTEHEEHEIYDDNESHKPPIFELSQIHNGMLYNRTHPGTFTFNATGILEAHIR